MDYQNIIYAIIAIVAWGGMLVPSYKVVVEDQGVRIFYISLAVIPMALIVIVLEGVRGLTPYNFWFAFIGGAIWSFANWVGYKSIKKLGIILSAFVIGILNVGFVTIFGLLLFNEGLIFPNGNIASVKMAFAFIFIGIVLLIKGLKKYGKSKLIIILSVLVAAVGSSSYFIPILLSVKEYSSYNIWTSIFPMSLGMLAGSIALLLINRVSPKLAKPYYYPMLLSTGILWGIGHFAAITLMLNVGMATAFSIAQFHLVLNVLIILYVLKKQTIEHA